MVAAPRRSSSAVQRRSSRRRAPIHWSGMRPTSLASTIPFNRCRLRKVVFFDIGRYQMGRCRGQLAACDRCGHGFPSVQGRHESWRACQSEGKETVMSSERPSFLRRVCLCGVGSILLLGVSTAYGQCTELQKLISSPPATYANFGQSVSIAEDLIVGGCPYDDNPHGEDAG